MHNLIEKIQKRIESLYDIKLTNNVKYFITNKIKYIEEFIGKDKKTKCLIYKNKEYGFTCCKVLDDKLESIVYISKEVTKNLKENNPFKSLNKRNITDFSVLVEEIDHWEYLNNKFELEKIPSNFELELQAAVTKYWVAIRSMLDYKENIDKSDINFLMVNIFPEDYFKLDKNTMIKRKEYFIANHFVRDYCNYLTGKSTDTILFSLRKFYRFDGKEKVDYVMRDFKKNPIL